MLGLTWVHWFVGGMNGSVGAGWHLLDSAPFVFFLPGSSDYDDREITQRAEPRIQQLVIEPLMNMTDTLNMLLWVCTGHSNYLLVYLFVEDWLIYLSQDNFEYQV